MALIASISTATRAPAGTHPHLRDVAPNVREGAGPADGVVCCLRLSTAGPIYVYDPQTLANAVWLL